MALFIHPIPSREAAAAIARQLERIREQYPTAQVRVVPPGESPEICVGEWRVTVEANVEIELMYQDCVDLLGE